MRSEVVCGSRVKWEYSRRYFQGVRGNCTKVGTLQRLVKHTQKYKGGQLAIVLFDNARAPSRVSIYDLTAIGKDK